MGGWPDFARGLRGRRPAGRHPRRGARRPPGALRRRRRRLDDPALGPIEVVGPCASLGASPGSIVAPAPTLDADGAALRADGWDPAGWSRLRRLPAAQPARRGPRRRVRHVLRRAVRPPAAVRPRCRGDQGRGHRRRPDAPAGGDLRGRQPRQAGDRRRPQAPEATGLVRRLLAVRPTSCSTTCAPASPNGSASTTPPSRTVRPDIVYHYSPGLRLGRPEVEAAELRPARVGLRRPVRRRRRRGQPPPPDVRQRGLLQRPARRMRLPARR